MNKKNIDKNKSAKETKKSTSDKLGMKEPKITVDQQGKKRTTEFRKLADQRLRQFHDPLQKTINQFQKSQAPETSPNLQAAKKNTCQELFLGLKHTIHER